MAFKLLGQIRQFSGKHVPFSASSPKIESVSWMDNDVLVTSRLLTSGNSPVKSVKVVKDSIKAPSAVSMARKGIGIVWQGDYHKSKELYSAMKRRVESSFRGLTTTSPIDIFRKKRQMEKELSAVLNMLLIPFEAGHKLSLRRAPDLSGIMRHRFGPATEGYVVSLRQVLGLIGAQQWRTNGLYVIQLHDTIFPFYSVFAPIRNEYLDLVLQAMDSSHSSKFQTLLEVGTGTGVLSAMLLKRQFVNQAICTDINPVAVECAQYNLDLLGFTGKFEVINHDLFPLDPIPVDLIICNPPWIPEPPQSMMDAAVFDNDSDMLRRFLLTAPKYLSLSTHAEIWLIMSNFAELLNIRDTEFIVHLLAISGLEIVEEISCLSNHPKTKQTDALGRIRSQETTTLYRIKRK